MTNDVHEVYAVRYGHHDRPAHENYIGGDPQDILEPLAYFVWVIKGTNGTFIMDTGFDPAMAAKRGRVIVKPVADGLKAIGIDPEHVTDVIISHLHYDHCGNHAEHELRGDEPRPVHPFLEHRVHNPHQAVGDSGQVDRQL